MDPGLGHWGYRTVPAESANATGPAAPRVTVDDIHRAHASECAPFVVKIDIEGGEIDVFAGNTEWVARTPVLIIELHDWLLPEGGTSAPFLKCIANLNRDFVYYGETVFSIANDLDELAES